MRRLLLAAAVAAGLAPPLAAEPQADPRALFEALGLPELLEIMREEGLGYGAELEADLFPGAGRAAWAATVARIYDTGRMEAAILDGLAEGLAPAQAAEALAFFQSEQGQRIVELEVAARRALLDDTVEEAALESWRRLEMEDGPRWQLLSRFAEANDLIDANVAGAMTSNYAFYLGMLEGSAFGSDLSEAEILSDVWSQEEAIRKDTEDWVFSFIGLAYQPLSDAELEAYIAFAETPAGQAVNRALFEAFNAMFAGISRDLGRGAARFVSGRDL
jgi:hypothetical protein